MSDLTVHQRAAVDAYQTLIEQRPELFRERPMRRIIQDRGVCERFAAEHDVILGVAAETRYSLFLVDLVESRVDGAVRRHPYERMVSRAQLAGGTNVVVICTIQNPALGSVGDLVLVEQERHALGTCEVELPRGFGEPGLSGEANALRELAEETGYAGNEATLLGTTLPNSGMSDTTVSFYHVPATRLGRLEEEPTEAIKQVLLMPPERVWASILDGRIRDGFTVQALGLYGAWMSARRQ